MDNSTKILTVSYGTFSCTLEGFDDPLGSMREIAEYFRDLAADDRYFGAEPPTPDVEMLQNLAQKEAHRRVEARTTETGIALVASDQPVSAPSKPVEAEAEAEDTGPLTFDDDFLMSDEPEDVLAVDPDAVADADGPAESVAEKLRRIRAVVSRSIEENEETPAEASAPKRDRANSETIREITADLADDEDAPHHSEDIIDHAAEDEPEAIEDLAEASAEAEDAAETAEATEDDDNASILNVLGKVTSRLEEDEETENDEEPTIEVSPGATRVISRTLTPEPEVNVGRLMEETDTKLNEDETVRRRRVISQMRAAVAATKADRLVSRQVSREVEEEAEQDPYREDLSEAVQEAASTEPRPSERSESVAPPLMLVSSQRVDDEPERAREAVETVQLEEPPVQGTPYQPPESFAAFVESVGARELDELLEAAAAYTIFAEGQPSFTRPEIMKRVAHADPTLQMSREDSLRSFGQLLRQGKFKKLDRGQFTIYENTRYHPTDLAGE